MRLPALGALGGMVVPGLIYWWINYDNPAGMAGGTLADTRRNLVASKDS